MRDMQRKIKQVELDIEADKSFVNRNVAELKQYHVRPVSLLFLAIAVIPVGLMLLRSAKARQLATRVSVTVLPALPRLIKRFL